MEPSRASMGFMTPTMPRPRATPAPGARPLFNVPPSPLMQRLGFGTGVGVYLLQTPSPSSHRKSPWAIKKVRSASRLKRLANDRLTFEAEILAGLNHPNIVEFRRVQTSADGDVQLAMKPAGVALMDRIERLADENDDIEGDQQPGRIPSSEILSIAHSIADALSYLHDNGILHGDLKSNNLLLDQSSGVVRLCDFGTSVRLDPDTKMAQDSNAVYSGAQSWAAPEVLCDPPVISDRADIYSFGMVLFEMMTLMTPHGDLDDSNFYEALGTPPSLPEHVVLDPELIPIVELFLACTSCDPAERPSAQELVLTLREFLPKDLNSRSVEQPSI